MTAPAPARAGRPGLRAAALRLFAVVLGTLAAAAGCELALRAAGFEYNPFQVAAPGAGGDGPAATSALLDARFTAATTTGDFVYDPELIWRPRPSNAVFDRHGLRGEVREPKPPEEFRILAVGDSNTLGWMVEGGANWPMYLGELFAAEQVRVINAGVWGYSSFQGRRRLERLRALDPDLVLISFGANDAHHRSFSDREYADRVRLLFVLDRLRLGQLVLRFLDSRFPLQDRSGEAQVPRVGVAEYRDNLRAMIAICRADGAATVLLTRPFTGPLPAARSWKHFAPDYNAAAREVGSAEGVPVVDLFRRFADRDELFTDESHFHEIGHRMAAEIVYDRIRPLVPAETGGRSRFEIRAWPGRLSGFYPETTFPKWTAGDARIERSGLRAGERTRWLAVDTYGLRRADPRGLGLRVEAGGRELTFSHRDDGSYLFELDPAPSDLDTVRIRSSTFSPAHDPRRLGLDVRAIRLVEDPADGRAG